MKQVVQAASGGAVEVVESPIPAPEPTEVLVRTHATVISPGTERAATQLAQSNLLSKARARPDLVRQVVEKARRDGIKATVNSVRARLEDDLLLGYSGAGEIVEVGSQVRGMRPGQMVATAGSGHACHAEYQTVPSTLVAPIPDGVDADEASFATIGAIAMHGFRLAEVEVGSKVVIVGLGLVGQLACRIAMAAGCEVAGIDVDPAAVDRAAASGVLAVLEEGQSTTDRLMSWSRGRGADAVLITAGTPGDSRIIRSTPTRCRDRATVVAVGDIGLDAIRNDFYHRELELKVARSYGPGRYDPSYESWGVDYPVGYVRWTEGRNLEAVLDLIAGGRVVVDDLVSHRFAIDEAGEAYRLLDKRDNGAVGIVLEYDPAARNDRRPETSATGRNASGNDGAVGVGICGAGLFVRSTLLGALRDAGLGEIRHVCSRSGTSAARLAEREKIPRTSADFDDLLGDPDVDLVVIASTHRTHADFAVRALKAGKHVYVEKPLAISDDELIKVEDALYDSPGLLHVGFNRRWAPMVVELISALDGPGPLNVHYRVNAGPLSPEHWYADRREGGRLLGEVCHFIDTANAIVGSPATTVHCASPNDDRHDSYTLLLSYPDGSAATVSYAADAHPATPKEWCEVHGRGHTVYLDDFRELTIDGHIHKGIAPGKGHSASLAAFARAIRFSGDWGSSEDAITTTRLALRATTSSLSE